MQTEMIKYNLLQCEKIRNVIHFILIKHLTNTRNITHIHTLRNFIFPYTKFINLRVLLLM